MKRWLLLWRRGSALVLLALLGLWAAASGWAQTGSNNVSQDAAVSMSTPARVIVIYRDGAEIVRAHPWRRGDSPQAAREAYQRRAALLSARHRVALQSVRAVGSRGHALRATGLAVPALVERLRADPDVRSVVIDQRRRALAVPNDPYFAAGPSVDLTSQSGGPPDGQWYLRAPSALFRSATHVQGAWSLTRGDSSIVVAVLDTGVLSDHEDLDPQRTGRVLAGYDLVEDLATANDGDGRDTDARDPGDWITAQEDGDPDGPYSGCGLADSSWHGTQVAGIVSAIADNGVGMTGVAPGVRLLPVRVLGKCGGWDSDIIAGLFWAAGLDQPGLPANPHPARVINLSLGGAGACTEAYQQAADALTARGVVMVAAAGNSAGHAVGAPANCKGVLAVAGLRHVGTKVGFSDLGPEIAIAAPGGNCVNIRPGEPCLYPLLTTTNLGLQQPIPGGSGYTDSFLISVGTSFAAPIVSATAALMLSIRPDLTPDQVRSLLQSTARAFPIDGADNGDDPQPVPLCRHPDPRIEQLQCYCTTALCGAGMLDAKAAVEAAQAFVAPAADTGGGAVSAGWLAALGLATGALRRANRDRRRPGAGSGRGVRGAVRRLCCDGRRLIAVLRRRWGRREGR